MKTILAFPTHIWLLLCVVIFLIAYYVRPDAVTVDLLKGFVGALLLALRTGPTERPPNPPPQNPLNDIH